VLDQGNSYTSRQPVPAGIDINNADFWAETGNYNAQVEQYRAEVAQFDDRITEAKNTGDNNTHIFEGLTDSLPPTYEDIRSRYYGVNVVSLGVDNTGTKNVSTKLQEIINSNNYTGLFFPNGTYNIDAPIDTKNLSVEFASGAKIVATKQIDYMFSLSKARNAGTYTRLQWLGGEFDGNGLAKTAFLATHALHIGNMQLRNFTNTVLDLSQCHGVRAFNIYIDGNNADVIGLKTSFDCDFNNIVIWNCKTGIVTRGINHFSNIYIWGGSSQENRITTGITGDGTDVYRFLCVNLYIDCCQVGITTPTQATINITNLFTFVNPNDLPNTIEATLFDLPEGTRVNLTNPRYDATRNIVFSKTQLTGHLGFTDNQFYTNMKYLFNSSNLDMQNGMLIGTASSIDITQGVEIAYSENEQITEAIVRTVYGDIWRHIFFSTANRVQFDEGIGAKIEYSPTTKKYYLTHRSGIISGVSIYVYFKNPTNSITKAYVPIDRFNNLNIVTLPSDSASF
jgi:hypothetical protein